MSCAGGHPLSTKLEKYSHKRCHFSGKSFGEWNEVEKPTVVPMSYEGYNVKEIEMASGYNENNDNNYNVVSNSECKDGREEKLFEDQIKEEIIQKW